MFVDRKTELRQLEKRYRSKTAEMLIVYGRRRVGKTRLLQEFSHNKKSIFFLADLSPDNFQTNRFTEVLYRYAGDALLKSQPLMSWDAIFEYLARLASKRKLLVIIDEFPYLLAVNPAIASILQRYWDEKLAASKIYLILCGSYISVMENKVLGHRSPLYGRRSSQLMLLPFDFFGFTQFFKRMPITNLIEYYAVCGGIPAYICQFKGSGLWRELRQNAMQQDAYLYEEIRFLLNEELREPHNYFALLQAIAFGKTRLNEISQMAKIETSKAIRYLNILKELRIINRVVPVTEKKPHKSRRGIYKISDNFTRFWFRYIYPNRNFIESNEQTYVINKKIKPTFNTHVSVTFEDICTNYLEHKYVFERIGRWWHKDVEIDIVGVRSSGEYFFGECKWTKKPVGMNIVIELLKKIEYFKDNVRGKVDKQRVFLFSKSGYTSECIEKAKSLKIRLTKLNDLLINS